MKRKETRPLIVVPPPRDYANVMAGLVYVEVNGASEEFWRHLRSMVRTECKLVYREATRASGLMLRVDNELEADAVEEAEQEAG